VFDRAETLAPLLLSASRSAGGGLLAETAAALVPWFTLPAAAATAAIFAQRAWVFAPEKLEPKASRISPLATAKRKFGPDGLFEFAKSTVKLALISSVLWAYFVLRMPRILESLYLDPGLASAELGRLIVEFTLLVVALLAGIGAADFLWQHHSHLRKNRMSHQEMRDELKQSEGDPHLRQQRRQRGYDIATNRMILDVPRADVVIVNPTHYAVALRWERGPGRAPVCVAKGTDAVAARIREAAAGAGVPIRRDPATARALHATVPVGAEILPEHYRAVAAAIRFAETMRAKARSSWAAGPAP
jgi:flagellar biosynthetic protein FlhB